MANAFQYDAREDFHFLGDDPDPEELELADRELAAEQNKAAKASSMLQMFTNDGWRWFTELLQRDIESSQQRILSGEFEDDPKMSAKVRGYVDAMQQILRIPEATELTLSIAEQRIEELSERPE